MTYTPCTCGCRSPHEVARRTTFDGGVLVVMSDGEHRVWRHRGLSLSGEELAAFKAAVGLGTPEVPSRAGGDRIWLDRFGTASRDVVGWACIYTASEVWAKLVEAHQAAEASLFQPLIPA